MLNQQKNSNLITFAKTCVFVFFKFKPNLPGNLFKAVIVVTGVCGWARLADWTTMGTGLPATLWMWEMWICWLGIRLLATLIGLTWKFCWGSILDTIWGLAWPWTVWRTLLGWVTEPCVYWARVTDPNVIWPYKYGIRHWSKSISTNIYFFTILISF